MRFKMMAIAATAILAVPAIAQTADSAATAKPKKEKKICRPADPNSYSHMRSMICRTQAEWDRNGDTGDAGGRSVRSVGGDNVPSS